METSYIWNSLAPWITLNDEGKMSEIEVLIRPLNTLIEFATRMREHALAYQPTDGVTA